jgi:AraC family transcriptional regulator
MEVLKKGTYSGDVKVSRKFGGLIATVTQYDPYQFNGSLHSHENTHLGFTLAGGCVEKKKQEYEISPGHICYYMAGERHQQVRVLHRSTRVNLELEESFCFSNGITENEICNALQRTPDVKFTMVKIYQELLSGDLYGPASVQMMLLSLFKYSGDITLKHPLPLWVKKVRDFLNDQHHEEVSLCQISKVAGVHPVTVSKYFPKYVGCTMGEYMRKLKVETALHLIKASNASLTSIAYECGFFDQSRFTRSFKHYIGILPKKYRG